ncbi:MAG: hypothetical protein OHK0023_03380 [Anaerolineae bacterium]
MVFNNSVAGDHESTTDALNVTEPTGEAVAEAASQAPVAVEAVEKSAADAVSMQTDQRELIESTESAEPTADPTFEAVDAPASMTAVETTDEAGEPTSMSAELLEQYDEPKLKKGEIVEGVVSSTSPTEILIDIGARTQGVVSGKELERMDKETLERLKVGEKVTVFVLTPENKAGRVVLSLSRATEEQDWRKAELLKESGEVYYGKVDGYNKGGLIVRIGRVRGFVPESQVSRERRDRSKGADPQEKWDSMRGEDISVKVLEVDKARNRLILSERDAAPALREQRKSALLDELQVGDRKTGRVKSISDFGAFVDIGGADGLVHLTELSWKHITHPKEALRVGQEVNVEVISIDRERKRIGLSIKRTEEDPWSVIARSYTVGQLVQGTVTKLTKFGAFARLVDNPEVEGLIHISELAGHRVGSPKEVVKEGDVLTLRVVKIDAEQRRIGLSLKKVSSPEYMETDYRRSTANDIADFEAGMLKEDDRRRDRKRGGGASGGKKGGKKGGKGDFEDDEFDY